MDSEHRHELKTNELADWLGRFPQFCKENSNYILGITIICVALMTAPMLTKMRKQKELAEHTQITQDIQMLDQDVYKVLLAADEDPLAKTEALNALLTNADALLDKASSIKKPDLAALAQIKAAQAIRTELHLCLAVDAETLETQVQKAEDAYKKAFETAQAATYKAMAQFGLALCSEELGQTAQAAEIYQQIIDEESYAATVLPTQAQKRLDELEDNAEVFNFAEVPVVIEEPASATESPMVITPQEITEAAAEPIVKETTEAADAEQAIEETAEPQAEQP